MSRFWVEKGGKKHRQSKSFVFSANRFVAQIRTIQLEFKDVFPVLPTPLLTRTLMCHPTGSPSVLKVCSAPQCPNCGAAMVFIKTSIGSIDRKCPFRVRGCCARQPHCDVFLSFARRPFPVTLQYVSSRGFTICPQSLQCSTVPKLRRCYGFHQDQHWHHLQEMPIQGAWVLCMTSPL